MNKFYVTKDVAEKLRAKGYYREYDVTDDWVEGIFYQVEDGTFYLPRIDEVLAWLREEKKIHIRPSVYFIGWCYDITMAEGKYSRLHGTECEYYSYEEAAIAGIEYCLDNLI